MMYCRGWLYVVELTGLKAAQTVDKTGFLGGPMRSCWERVACEWPPSLDRVGTTQATEAGPEQQKDTRTAWAGMRLSSGP